MKDNVFVFKCPNGEKLYENPKFEFREGQVNVLIGPNGTGKTNLLSMLDNYLKKEKIMFVHYSNLNDGGLIARQSFLEQGNFRGLAGSAFHSEGETMHSNFLNLFFGKFNRKVKLEEQKENPRDEIWLLIDGMDSGYDIPNNRELLNLFDNIMLNDLDTKVTELYPFIRKIYVVIAANSYEYARDREVLDVLTGKWMSFKDYDDYANHIIATKDKVFKRNEEYEENRRKEREKRKKDQSVFQSKYRWRTVEEIKENCNEE